MKKFLALVLAVAMAMSMASVAFAVSTNETVTQVIGGNNVGVIGLVGPFDYSADDDLMRTEAELAYGDTAFYLITDGTGAPVSNFEAVEKLKVKAEFEMGEDLVESISIVKKSVVKSFVKDSKEKSELVSILPDDGYYYFVGVKIANKETTADADIIGTFTFNRKAVDLKDAKDIKGDSTFEYKIDDAEIDFAINVFYATKDYLDSGKAWVVDGKQVVLDYDTAYALKFDCDEEVDIEFGGDDNNEGTFTVDVSGQGKRYIKWNTNANEAIVAANPGVKMFFVNFNNVKFNRAGEFEYEMDDVAAAYKVVGDELVAIPGVEIDVDAVTFTTRVLESYVFATAELVNPVVAAPVVDAPVAEVTNPSTGA